MKRLFYYADKYLQESDWRVFAIIKLCLFSMGVLAGTYIPKKKIDCARIIALIGFVATYIPLMLKFFKVVTDKNKEIPNCVE